jgi:phosphate transport system substrate-binding protein
MNGTSSDEHRADPEWLIAAVPTREIGVQCVGRVARVREWTPQSCIIPSSHARRARTPSRWLGVLTACTLMCLLALGGCSGVTAGAANDSGSALVVGSTALQPLVTAAAQLYTRQHPHVRLTIRGGGSKLGLQAVTSHQADVGDSDIYADPAVYPDPDLTDHLVAVIPFAMVVNPDVSVSNLTQAQLIEIFSTGQITNWAQVGGPNLPIVPVVRPSTSGTRATFRKYILGGRDEIGKLLTSDSSQTVRNTVSSTPGAIGYLALSVLDASVHVVSIDGQRPTPQTIEQGQYAFWGYEHMYTIGAGSGVVQGFLDFMLTPAVQQLAQQLGYIPIAGMQLPSFTGSAIAFGTNTRPARPEGSLLDAAI